MEAALAARNPGLGASHVVSLQSVKSLANNYSTGIAIQPIIETAIIEVRHKVRVTAPSGVYLK
jgi:hypothetical protein